LPQNFGSSKIFHKNGSEIFHNSGCFFPHILFEWEKLNLMLFFVCLDAQLNMSALVKLLGIQCSDLLFVCFVLIQSNFLNAKVKRVEWGVCQTFIANSGK